MTTPSGNILFNNSSGSDTQASGLGPATAVYGSGASTDGTAVVTGITTTGVSAGDLLWVQTASGRQFSIIASVDSSTQVTCDDTFALGSGQTWAIGGKRATWDDTDSRQLFQDVNGKKWTITTETDQTLNSLIEIGGVSGSTTNGSIVVMGDDSSNHRVINCTGNHSAIGTTLNATWQYFTFKNLKFTNTSSSKTNEAAAFRYRLSGFDVVNCIFGDATNQLYAVLKRRSSSVTATFSDCIIQNCISDGITDDASTVSAKLNRCIIRNNGGHGVLLEFGSITNSIIYGNSTHGIAAGTSPNISFIVGNVIYNNGGDGISLSAVSANNGVLIENNAICSNTSYGIGWASSSSDAWSGFVGDNAYYNNGSGDVQSTIAVDGTSTTLTADPFTDAAAADFTINSDAGGGSTLRSTAITLGSTETRPFRWLDTSTGGGATGSSRLVNGGLVD